MKGTDKRNETSHKDQAQKDVLEELFQHATARQRPQAGDEQEIRNAVHFQWRQMIRRRRRKRITLSLAAAASLALAVIIGNQIRQPVRPPTLPIPLATVEKIHGGVFVHPLDKGPASRLAVLTTVQSGQRIVTGRDSRLALRWRDGTSLRMDQTSEIRLETTGVVNLVTGRLYVDSGVTENSANPLTIMTQTGAVTHLGTQYMTRYENGETTLSVREGRAAIEIDGMEIVATQGEQLIVEPSGVQTRQRVAGYGELWEWTQSLAPDYQLDGRSVADFLDYVAIESGRTIEYASIQAERMAAGTLLRGNVEIEPFRALQTVLQTTELESQIRDGAIVIALRQ